MKKNTTFVEVIKKTEKIDQFIKYNNLNKRTHHYYTLLNNLFSVFNRVNREKVEGKNLLVIYNLNIKKYVKDFVTFSIYTSD